MDPRLAVLVALVDVDVGHVEELLQPRLVILLYRAEDGGQHEVVILELERTLDIGVTSQRILCNSIVCEISRLFEEDVKVK